MGLNGYTVYTYENIKENNFLEELLVVSFLYFDMYSVLVVLLLRKYAHMESVMYTKKIK